MPFAVCDSCRRLYDLHPEELSRSYCPHCGKPLRLIGDRQDPALPVERLPPAPSGDE